MPEIPVYNAGGGTPPTELRPNPAGVEATAQAGWRIGRAFDQSGADIGRSIAAGGEAFQQHVASQEITQLAPLLAAHRAQRDAAWNAATSQPDFDPFNPTARINAMQTIATDYSNLEKGVTTKIAKGYLQKDMLQETERFNMQTIGDIAQLSANKTLDGAIKTSNIYLQNITDNPSSLDANIGGIHSYVQSMIQLHGAQMGDKGIDQMHTWEREQETAYTVRAYESSISHAPTPEAVDAIMGQLDGDTTHSEFIDGTARGHLTDVANSQKNAIYTDQERQHTLAKQQQDDTSRVKASQYMEVLSGKGSKGGAPDMTDDKTHQQWNTTVLADPDLTNTDKSDLIGLGERTASQTREQRTEGNIPMMQQMLHQIVTKNNLSDHDIYAAVTPNGINFEQARNLIDAAHPKDSADPMFTKLLDADLEYVRQYYPATSGGYADQAGAKSQNDALTYYTQRAYQLHQAGVPDAEIFSPKGSNSIYNGRTIDSWGAPVQSGAPKGATTGQHPFDISAALQNILSSIAGIGPGNQYGQPVLIQGGPQAGQQTREQSDHALAQSMWGQ